MAMWDNVEVVPLDMALQQLRLTSSDEQDDIDWQLAQAHAIVLDYIDRSRVDDADWHAEILAWTPDTAPKTVQAAICRQLADLRKHRGDEDQRLADGFFPSPWVRQLLCLYRDPVLS